MARTFIRVAGAAAMVASLWVGAVSAQSSMDKRTLFTFNGPVAVPGVTLPAGQYVFRLTEGAASHNVVQVMSADGMKMYGMFYIWNVQRAQPPARPEIRFLETGAGAPQAVRTWWYPGETKGYEFVYPKDQARRLAQGSGQPVLTTVAEAPVAPEAPAPQLARITPAGEETRVAAADVPTMEVAGPSQAGEVASPALAIAEPAPQASRAMLPKTAGTTGEIALAGVILLLSGLFLTGRRLARR